MLQALKNDFNEPEKLSTRYRVTKQVHSSKDNLDFTYHKKLVAHKSPEGLYCIREQSYGNSSEGHGYSDSSPFSAFQKLKDLLNKYEDYTLTLGEVEAEFEQFRSKHPQIEGKQKPMSLTA